MNTDQIAKELVALCRAGKFEEAQKKLFAQDAVSIEPEAAHGFEKETKGLPAIIEKGQKWSQGVEKIHSLNVSDPLVAGDAFAVTMNLDIAMKGRGRMNMGELCVYEVKDGKIASESFHM